MTINPSGSTSVSGSVDVTVQMTAIAVSTEVSGVTWIQDAGDPTPPPTPRILVGELATGSITVPGVTLLQNDGSNTYYSWQVPGSRFKDWQPTTPPTLNPDLPASDLLTANPAWHWKANATQTIDVLGRATASFPENLYNPTQAQVSDDFPVEVVRPASNISSLEFYLALPPPPGKPYVQYVIVNGVQEIELWTAIRSNAGTLWPTAGFPSGTYGICQVITSSTRDAGAHHLHIAKELDATYPYAKNQQIYNVGETINFGDSPINDSVDVPCKVDDKYADTVMFKPASPGACWVPIEVATWSWSASITSFSQVPPLYQRSPIGTQSNSGWTTTITFPDWDEVYP